MMDEPISDQMIERVARRMCEEMGIMPDELVQVRNGEVDDDTDRPVFIVDIPPPYRTVHYPSNGEPPYLVADPGYMNTPIYQWQPRWMLMRKEALRAIAAWRAVHKYALIDS